MHVAFQKWQKNKALLRACGTYAVLLGTRVLCFKVSFLSLLLFGGDLGANFRVHEAGQLGFGHEAGELAGLGKLLLDGGREGLDLRVELRGRSRGSLDGLRDTRHLDAAEQTEAGKRLKGRSMG